MILSYDERDGFNNQLVALRFACAIANITNRKLVLPFQFHNHAEGIVKNAYRLRVCDVVQCDSLLCMTIAVAAPASPVKLCRSLSCVESARSWKTVHLPNKAAFRMGLAAHSSLAKRIRNVPDIPISNSIVQAASRFETNEFSVIHIRQFSSIDYPLGGRQSEPPPTMNLTRRVQSVVRSVRSSRCNLKLKRLYVMTQDCHLPPPITPLATCIHANYSHSDMNCLFSQLVATRAKCFWGEGMSTVSQFVMRKRFPKDRSIRCNAVWCWFVH